MAVEKFKASGTPDLMKTDDRIDTILRQAVGREPLFYFPRANESPVQWVPLLHAFDPQGVSNSYTELPGWPLLYPLRVQLQKCEKCSEEFCSPINCRRHIRVHHRLKKLDKDYTKTRDLLGAYWDKLSVEEAKEVVSFENVMLEEVEGSSILKALTNLIQRQGFFLLPRNYVRAGAALLDIVQSKPSSFPISSQELFSILDDASEKTYLWGTAESMQRYVFDGEAGKIGLEPKNVVACTSFLLEQILVKAWLADKDAEALRCQKQLVEEEEAAQKRQAEILRRKRQKKLRQKEQRAREQRQKAEAEIKGNVDSTVKALPTAEASLDTYNSEAHDPEKFANNAPSHVPSQCPDTNEGTHGDTQTGHDCDTDQNIERRSDSEHGHNHLHIAVVRQQELPNSQQAVANALNSNQNSPISKLEVIQKDGSHHDQKAAARVKGSKARSQKPKPEIDRVVLKTTAEKEPDPVKNHHEVLIGSISVNLGSCGQSEGNVVASGEDCMVENVAKWNISQDKPVKPDLVMTGDNQSTVKLSMPVCRLETKDPFPVQSGGTEVDSVHRNEDRQDLSGPSCLKLCSIDGSHPGLENIISHPEGRVVDPGRLRFSSHAAKAFLEQRWKEAISSDHVELVVSLDCKSPRSQEIQDFKEDESSDVDRCNNLKDAENRLPASSGVSKSIIPRKKSKKGTKKKNIP